jgi:imidazolonepropionase
VTTLLVDESASWSRTTRPWATGPRLACCRKPPSSSPTARWRGWARPPGLRDADERIDLGGRAVLPGFVDSHSHLVFAGDRSAEFSARMSGEPYDGGGIAATVRATREAGDATLRHLVGRRVAEMRAQGTTTVEIKSGYGLTVEQEARALRIAREFTDEVTFLGAHVVPPGVDRRDYVAQVTGPMLRACAPLARWADVFCEPGSAHAFDADEARAVLTAAARAGLLLRVHGNQLGPGPGVRLAVELGAAAVDHCTFVSDSDIEALAASRTVATLLPGVEFSTKSPYPSARRLIDAGVTVALATDCNPGTSYTTSMPLMVALAVRGDGHDPGRGGVGGHRGRGPGPAPGRHRPPATGGPGRPGRARRAQLPPSRPRWLRIDRFLPVPSCRAWSRAGRRDVRGRRQAFPRPGRPRPWPSPSRRGRHCS